MEFTAREEDLSFYIKISIDNDQWSDDEAEWRSSLNAAQFI